MAEFFESEDDRCDQGLPLLNAIFSCRKENVLALHVESFCSYRSDGHNLAAHQSPGTVVEFKNKITGITSIPEIEAAAYVAQLNIASRYRSKLFGRWRMPCLGLTVIGECRTPLVLWLRTMSSRTPGDFLCNHSSWPPISARQPRSHLVVSPFGVELD